MTIRLTQAQLDSATGKRRRPKPKGPKESEIQADILGWLRTLPRSSWIRVNSGGAMLTGGHFIRFTDRKGVSDIIGCIHDGQAGLPVMIEVKRTPKDVPSDDQKAFQAAFSWAGALCLVVSSVAQVKKAFQREGLV